jgi:hypothetical protein
MLLLMSVVFVPRDHSGDRTHGRILLGVALALPLARLVIYLPWPLQFPYYSIPFLTGVIIVAALGATRLSEQAGPLRVVAIVSAAAVIAYAASVAGAQSSRYFALRRLTDAWVTALHELSRDPSITTVIVAVPTVKEQAWTGLGPTLSRYGAATRRLLPAVREVSCTDGDRLADAFPTGVALTALRHQCLLRTDASSGPLEVSRRFDFSRFNMVADSLRAQIIPPGHRRLTGEALSQREHLTEVRPDGAKVVDF